MFFKVFITFFFLNKNLSLNFFKKTLKINYKIIFYIEVETCPGKNTRWKRKDEVCLELGCVVDVE